MPGNKSTTELKTVDEVFAVEKIRLTFMSFLVFMTGLPSALIVNLVGELFITELILPVLAILILIFGKTRIFREKLLIQFIVVCIFMMLAYIVSDVVAGTDASKYLRAWGRNFILFTDLIALAIIVGSDRRYIWWFILGMSTGDLLYLIISHVPITEWKIGYGQPVILITLLLGSLFSFRVTMFSLVALGTISISLDSRSMGAMCLLVSGVIYLRVKYPQGIKLQTAVVLRGLIATLLVFGILITLMNQTADEFSNRRDSSSTGRFTALGIGLIAVSDSPLLGHGSWGQGTQKYADMVYEDLKGKMDELGRGRKWERGERFRPHSQILQAWMEGGIFAAIFFIFLGYQLFIGLKYTILIRKMDYFTPLYSFLFVLSTWNLFMSPYGGNHRIPIAISIALMCLLSMDRKATRKNKVLN